MDDLSPLDLHFLGLERAISVYVVDTADGPALFDCGPATTLPRLHQALAEHGLELRDLRHLLLSHIHFDHAGAAGALVREHPRLTVWVSDVGAPHLVDPSRLESSARRLYGDSFDQLWGALTPLPQENLRTASGDVVGWEVLPSPGHASHHVCYFRDGTLLAGDACGVRPQPADYVLPVAPPPDVDVEAWHETIAAIARRRPARLALVHFGVATDADVHLRKLSDELDRWAAAARDAAEEEEFLAFARGRVGADAELYSAVAPFAQSWQGLRRYWDKRSERTGAAPSSVS